jgi:putative FmdB family regulatory protein
MPIYAYKCESCGHAKDVLQKMSDAPLVDCPACGAATFKKQLTAAGFQLKGSGWYVTDFRDGKGGVNSGGDKPKEGDKSKEFAGAEKTATPASSGSDSAAAPAKAATATPAAAPVAASPTTTPKATP